MTDAARGGGPEGERRVVTTLFADLSGSTAVAGRMDAEEWADVAHEALASMSERVDRYGGTVARLMGDGLLAFFGAPTAHEDDAERAVRAALEIVAVVSELRAVLVGRLAAAGVSLAEDELRVRVGITTGSVVAAAVGGDVKSEYTALGDSVNLAARLEQAAEPGTVLIADQTRRLVGHVASTRPAGLLDLKGVDRPVAAHVVESLLRERGSARGLGSTMPSVGRDAEREVLREAIADLDTGRSGILLLVGEAGLGKSRLLADLRQEVADGHPGTAWYESECLSFESTMPYAVARRLLAATGGAQTPSLRRRLESLPEDRRQLYAEVLAGLEDGLDSGPAASPETLALAFGEVLAGVAGNPPRPVMVIVDDVHWADAASTDLLVALLSHTDRLPLLFVFATRPERVGSSRRLREVAAADFPDRFREVAVRPLGADESRRLVMGLLTSSEVAPEVVDGIARRAEGNPFYLEELVRELIDSGAFANADHAGEGSSVDGVVPETLQTLMQARFDRLGDGARATLELASVVGRVFDAGTVALVRDTDVTGDLRELLKVGLVEELDPRSRTFSFRHALAHEAAYRSILQRRRRALHRTVGELVETQHGDEPDVAPVLASHFLAAGDGPRACRYCLVSGDRAMALGALIDAAGHYDRGVRAVDGTVDDATAIALLVGRGRARDLLGDRDLGRADLEEALARARHVGDARREWETHIALGELWAAERYDRTGDHYRAALELARASGTDEMVATSLNKLGNWFVNAEDPPQGIRLHEEALEIFEQLGSEVGVTATHDLLGAANLMGGESSVALEWYATALEGFRAEGDRSGAVSVLVSSAILGPSYEAMAEAPMLPLEASLAKLEEAYDLVAATGWSAGEAYVRLVWGQLLGFTGELGGAIDQTTAGLDVARRIGHAQWLVGGLVTLGSVETDALDLEGSESHLGEALEAARQLGSFNWLLQTAAALGITLIHGGRPDEAGEVVAAAVAAPAAHRYRAHRTCRLVAAWAESRAGRPGRALELLDGFEAEVPAVPGRHEIAPMVALIRGEAMVDLGHPDASAVVRRGLEIAGHWGIRPLAWRLHLLLARLGDEVESHRRAASLIVDSMADTLEGDRGELLRRRAASTVGA